MGITGLLPFVRNSCRSASIRDFSGGTVAIDAYSWLHKGAFSCADKLVKGEKTDGYIFYCMKLLNMLLDCGVKPIMVFDGCNLPSKEGTEKKRRENREKTRQRGKEFLCQGKLKEARECFQRCVDVTPEMAREVIEACRRKSIDCIVAPYEADAQLAYLNKIGMAHVIITEDSDLILFGCEKILFKMDSGGLGLLYEKENLPKSLGAVAERFSFEKFRYMCILSGCDYLPSLHGIGLAKAYKFFSLTNNPDIYNVLSKLPNYLKKPKLVVSAEYRDSFIKANNTFLYQLVFCPTKKTLVPLNAYPEVMDHTQLEYAGKYLPDRLAVQMAMGNVNVNTLKKFNEYEAHAMPDDFGMQNSSKNSIWSHEKAKSFTPQTEISAFKHCSKPAKIDICASKKRNFSETQSTETVEESDDLFAMYADPSSEYKHQKLEEPVDCKLEMECEESVTKTNINSLSFLPFAKRSKTKDLDKSTSKLLVKKIVRSRFFSDEITVKGEPAPQEKPSLLETIDNELQEVTSTLSSERKFTKILSPRNKKANPEENVTDDEAPRWSEIGITPKPLGKENIIHRFAKKKIHNFKWKPQVGSTNTKNHIDHQSETALFVEKDCDLDSTINECGNDSIKKYSTKGCSDGFALKKAETGVSSKIDKDSIVHRFAKKKVLPFKWSRESTKEISHENTASDTLQFKRDERISIDAAVRTPKETETVASFDISFELDSTCEIERNTSNFIRGNEPSDDLTKDTPEFDLVLDICNKTPNSESSEGFHRISPSETNRGLEDNVNLSTSIDDTNRQIKPFDICNALSPLPSSINTSNMNTDLNHSALSGFGMVSPSVSEIIGDGKTDKLTTPTNSLSTILNCKYSRQLPINTTLGSDGNSFNESLEENASMRTTPQHRTSIFFQPSSSNSCVKTHANNSLSENVVLISSDSEDFTVETDKSNTVPKKSKNSISPVNLFNRSFKQSNNSSSKMIRCRSIGLSKKRNSDKKVNRKETLLSFNFVRQPKAEVVALN